MPSVGCKHSALFSALFSALLSALLSSSERFVLRAARRGYVRRVHAALHVQVFGSQTQNQEENTSGSAQPSLFPPHSGWLPLATRAHRHVHAQTHIHSIWDHTASIIPSVNLCEPSLSPLSPGSSVTPAHLISPLSPKWRVGVITRRSDRAREARACSRRRKGPAGSMMSPPPPSSSTYAHKSKQEGDVFNQKRKERGLNKSGHLSCNNAEFPGCICAYICLHASVKRAGK